MKDLLNYSNVFYICHSESTHQEIAIYKEHRLFYIYSGTASIVSNGHKVVLTNGDCVFIPKNLTASLMWRPKNEEPFSMNIMVLNPSFLLHVYPIIELKSLLFEMDDNISNIIKLPSRPDVTSLFESFTPYFNTTFQPSEEIIQLKILEGIYSLMNIDKRFFRCLFDFSECWGVDLYHVFNL